MTSEAPATEPHSGHIYEADLVRVAAVLAVIGVHTVSQCHGPLSVTGNGAVAFLHFVRQIFFVLSGFVLVHSYIGRTHRLGQFWWRRLSIVVVPYLAWTVIYSGLQWYQGSRTMSVQHWLWLVWFYTAHGDAWFHLYFLLVIMQVYLAFPVLAALLRITRGHHLILLVASGVLQVVTLVEVEFVRPNGGVLGWFTANANVLLPTYQFYVVLGGVSALHFAAIRTWFARHTALVVVAFLATATAVEIVYGLRVHHGRRPIDAADVLHPVVVPWSLVAVAVLFAAGVHWTQRRHAGSLTDRAIAFASQRSFGIYLSHPAILFAILWSGDHWMGRHLHGVALSVIVFTGTVIGAAVLTELLQRSPLSMILTGRPRVHWRRQLPRVDQLSSAVSSGTR